jgi:hypothetical protein
MLDGNDGEPTSDVKSVTYALHGSGLKPSWRHDFTSPRRA